MQEFTPPVSHKRNNKYIIKLLLCLLLFTLFFRNLTRLMYKSNTSNNITNRSSQTFLYNRAKGVPYNPNSYSLRVDFAKEESGTKIIAQSSSLTQLSNIQTSDRNTYMLAPCQTTDWFVLSFQESILVEQICFLSYEYYASTYRNIRISASDVYPSTKWRILANVETKSTINEIFDIFEFCKDNKNDCWTKYLKVELLDYHSVEDNYYCSITTMKVYGKTAVEVLENEITNDVEYLGDKVMSKEGKKSVTSADTSSATTSSKPTSTSALELKNCKVVDNTFVYNMKKMINNSMLRFLYNLVCGTDTAGVNKKILLRMLRMTRVKRYYKCNNKSQFCCTMKILGDFILKNLSRYSAILSRVQLPIKHTWFDYVIYRFIKSANITDCLITNVGIMEAPILICVESKGFIGRFKCYSYFNLSSFSTLLYNKVLSGFKINKAFFTEKFHFLHANSKTLTKVPMLMCSGGKRSKGRSYKFANDRISSISVKNDALVLFLVRTVNKSNAALKSLIKSNDFLTTLSKYIDSHLRSFRSRSRENGTLLHGRNLFVHQFNFEEEETDSAKTNGRSRHVLLKLSERIKVLEFVTNQLSSKTYESEKLLNTYLTYLLDAKIHIEQLEAVSTTIDEWKNAIAEVYKTIEMLGIHRLMIVFRRNKSIEPAYNTFLLKHLSNRYTSRIMYNDYRLTNVCDVVDCYADAFKRFKLNRMSKRLNRFMILDYCSRHFCQCTPKKRKTHTLLIWLPHFVKRRSKRLLFRIFLSVPFVLFKAMRVFYTSSIYALIIIIFACSHYYWFLRFRSLEKRLKAMKSTRVLKGINHNRQLSIMHHQRRR